MSKLHRAGSVGAASLMLCALMPGIAGAAASSAAGPTAISALGGFLTHPVVTTLLLMIGIVGIGLELLFWTSGLLGTAGVLGFGLYFLGNYLAGGVGSLDIGLFVLGVILLLLELIIPSFGILGIAGTISLFSGVILAAESPQAAALSLAIAFVIGLVLLLLIVKKFPQRGIWNRLILKEELTSEQGFVSSSFKLHLIGQTGTSLTPLRPSGTALFGEDRIDVVTEGGFITAGKSVRVVHVEGSRVVVHEEKDEHPAQID
ncbi:NfeD family protein [Paenibacillus sp. FJAT-26967]|uniref:NfeD family protein n=1 Tax=Paenibacillus sp. FJAT-26967 TaxID=1729690 RepID=UPI0008398BC9|nr:NfeD family protein [Paenibacillus sp. FJAT-26967]